MNEMERPGRERKVSAQLPIVWGALTFSMLIYVAMLFLIRMNPESRDVAKSASASFDMTLAYVFGAIALVLVMLIFVLPSRVSGNNYFVYCLLRWSFAEAIAIFGLVLGLLGASWDVVGGFFLVGLALNLFNFPSKGDYNTFRKVS